MTASRRCDPIFPISGTCERCLRERDDLFWHERDGALYCADVFRCEARYFIQGEKQASALARPAGRAT